MKRNGLALVLLALVVISRGVAAQPPEAERRERARTFLVLRIAEALKLNDADALKVSAVIRQSDERRQALVQQRQTLEDTLRATLAKQPADTAELTRLITAGNDLDQKLALVPEDSFRELQTILTVEQQARLILFRRELQSEIRRALQGRRPPGKGRERRDRPAPPASAPGTE